MFVTRCRFMESRDEWEEVGLAWVNPRHVVWAEERPGQGPKSPRCVIQLISPMGQIDVIDTFDRVSRLLTTGGVDA